MPLFRTFHVHARVHGRRIGGGQSPAEKDGAGRREGEGGRSFLDRVYYEGTTSPRDVTLAPRLDRLENIRRPRFWRGPGERFPTLPRFSAFFGSSGDLRFSHVSASSRYRDKGRGGAKVSFQE